MTGPSPFFSVVVPTRGDPAKLDRLIAALERQTLPRDRWECIVAFDGTPPTPEIARRLDGLGVRIEVSRERQGPGAARNAAAGRAAGEVLAFTEDDCEPAPNWLEAAAAAFAREPSLDALEGATLLPDGRPARRRDGRLLTWLPTNLFVRRPIFEGVGGYCERFFDPSTGIYFREDSDFGFGAEERGARVAFDPAPRVTHPREHPGSLDPIRWARRYEMDPLLRSRHPVRFRDRIEVARWGPIWIRRPFVRTCVAHVVTALAAIAALVGGETEIAAWLAFVAALLLVGVWAKWRFAPARLLVIPLVPWVLLGSLLRGSRRPHADRLPSATIHE